MSIRLFITEEGKIIQQSISESDVTDLVFARLREDAVARGVLVPGILPASWYLLRTPEAGNTDCCFTLVRMLTGIGFFTHWAPDVMQDGAVFRPVFYDAPTSVTISPTPEKFFWKPPADMALFLTASAVTQEMRGDKGKDDPFNFIHSITLKGSGSVSMAAVDKKTGRAYVPPFPNLHSNGSMCTGEMTALNDKIFFSAEALLEAVADHVATSRWNRDLLNEDIERVFMNWVAFDGNGKQIKQMKPGSWQSTVRVFSQADASEAIEQVVHFCIRPEDKEEKKA